MAGRTHPGQRPATFAPWPRASPLCDILTNRYDPQANRGSAFVGVSYETTALAAASISRCWTVKDTCATQTLKYLLILADTGGKQFRHV